MSSKLYGEGTLPEKIKIVGKPMVPATVSVQAGALLNRATDRSVINKYLKEGFDWKKFIPPLIARFPEGYTPSARFKERFYKKDGRLFALLDGDHRRHMFILAFPTQATMCTLIVDVKDEYEYHRLFGDLNYKYRKNCNANQVFLHDVLSGLPEARHLEKNLQTCKLSVEGSPEEGGTVGFPAAPNVNIPSFKTMVRLTSVDAVRWATEAMKFAYPTDTKFSGDLLGGLAICYHLYPCLSTSQKISNEFEAWFRTCGLYEQARKSRDLKLAGGDVHHKQMESIARGIIKDFRDANAGCCNKKYKQKVVPIARVDGLF